MIDLFRREAEAKVKAILSDAHGNLEALRAVLDDIDRRGVSVIYNLGDTIGYGPNPLECIDLSMEMAIVLLGHFDNAVLFDRFVTSSPNEDVLRTRQVLTSPGDDPAARQRRIEFLSSLQPSDREAGVLYVHGSAREPLSEYVFPEDVYNARKMARIGELFDHVCFAGHTHVAGIFVENAPEQWQFIRPGECGGKFQLDGRKTICNVGSTGQPLDGDWRVSYVLFDGTTIQFCRVAYDRDATANRMRGM